MVGANMVRRPGEVYYVCSINKTHGKPTTPHPLWNESLYLKETIPDPHAPQVVFFHISKCGGTLMCALAKNATARRAGARNCQLAGGNALKVINGRQVIYNYSLRDVEYNPNTSICYHVMRNQYRSAYANSLTQGLEYMTFESGVQGQVRARIAISVQPHMYFVTMLRSPYKHSVSAFNFFNRRGKPMAEWFAGMGSAYIDDIYTRTFSDAPLRENLTDQHLGLAMDTLNRLNLVLILPEDNGCTNFIDILCKRLAWQYFCGNPQVSHVNVGEVRRNLTSDEVAFIRSKIVWDNRLYAHAVQISPCLRT
jgi:hypothetical protein